MTGLIVTLVVFFFFFKFISSVTKSAKSGKEGSVRSTKLRSGGYQIPKRAYMNRQSVKIRRESERIDKLDKWHENLPFTACKYSYTTEDPTFDFNGYDTVDECAELRKKAQAHEAHLRARTSTL